MPTRKLGFPKGFLQRAPGRRSLDASLASVVKVDDEIAYADVFALRRRAGTAEALVEVLLGRITALDAPGSPSALRSVLAVSGTAISEARACDRSDPSGPLHGVPVLVKDNIEVAGLPSTAGATSLVGRPATPMPPSCAGSGTPGP